MSEKEKLMKLVFWERANFFIQLTNFIISLISIILFIEIVSQYPNIETVDVLSWWSTISFFSMVGFILFIVSFVYNIKSAMLSRLLTNSKNKKLYLVMSILAILLIGCIGNLVNWIYLKIELKDCIMSSSDASNPNQPTAPNLY